MNHSEEHATSTAVRASDAERDQVAAQLQHHYAVGRLTLPELEERVAGSYEARTREQLDALMRDLPLEAEVEAAPPVYWIDTRLLIILLCTSPPSALIYWLICFIRQQTLERRAIAASEPNHGGRPQVIDDNLPRQPTPEEIGPREGLHATGPGNPTDADPG